MKRIDNNEFNIANRPMAGAYCVTPPKRQRSYPNQRSELSKPLSHTVATITPVTTTALTSTNPRSCKLLALIKTT